MTVTPTAISSKDFNDLQARVIVMINIIKSLETVISSVSKKFPFNKRLEELFRLNHHIDKCLKRLYTRVIGQQVSKSLNVSEYELLAAETDNLERLVKSFAALVPDIIKCFTGCSGHSDSDPNSGTSTSGPPPSQSQSITKSATIPNLPPIKSLQQAADSDLDVLNNRSDFEISSDIITDGKTVNLEAVKKLCLAGRHAAVLRAAMKHIGDRAKLIAIINFLLSGGYIVVRDIMEINGDLYNEIQSLLIKN